jgi:hypothetical protein
MKHRRKVVYNTVKKPQLSGAVSVFLPQRISKHSRIIARLDGVSPFQKPGEKN